MDAKKEAGRVSLDMNARGYESVFSKTMVGTIFILWSGGIDDSVLTVTNDKGTRYFRLTELGLRAPISSSAPSNSLCSARFRSFLLFRCSRSNWCAKSHFS